MPSVPYDGFLLETSDTNIQYKSPQKILWETKFSNFNLALSQTSGCRENHVAKYSTFYFNSHKIYIHILVLF